MKSLDGRTLDSKQVGQEKPMRPNHYLKSKHLMQVARRSF
jgi:hypothetical protein